MYRQIATAVLAVGLLAPLLEAGIAQTRPSDIQWTGKAGGQVIQVPAGEKPTVMLFVRSEQATSIEVLEQAPKMLSSSAAQVVVVYSGPSSEQQAQQAGNVTRFPAVADPDYSLSGKMGVHVWPTTVMLNAKGDVMAHIAGVSQRYALEFSSSLDFLAGKIDRAALDAKLNDRKLVADTAVQAAGRHLQIATRMIQRDRLSEARSEIDKGLKLQPGHAHLQLALIRVLLLEGETDEAAAILEGLKPGSAPAAQLSLAQGRVLAAKGDIEGAIAALQKAVKLNPNPSEAQYELGLLYQKQGQWEKAATAFRIAYESHD